jgi:hypothetical protein
LLPQSAFVHACAERVEDDHGLPTTAPGSVLPRLSDRRDCARPLVTLDLPECAEYEADQTPLGQHAARRALTESLDLAVHLKTDRLTSFLSIGPTFVADDTGGHPGLCRVPANAAEGFNDRVCRTITRDPGPQQ